MRGTIPSLPSMPTVPGLGSDAVGSFSPDQISGLQMWFDASDASTLWQNEAGTTPSVADTDPVGRWSDKSSNLWFLTSPNALSGGDETNRPLLRTNIINALPVVRMNGSLSFLRRVTSISITGTELTVFWVGQRVSFINANEGLVSLAQIGLDDHGNVEGAIIGHSAPDPTDLSDSRNNAVLTDLTHPGNGVPFTYASKYDGTNQTGYLNGVAGTPVASTGSFLIQRLLIGFRNEANINSIVNPNNDDYGEILIYNRALTDPELSQLNAYALDKWGV